MEPDGAAVGVDLLLRDVDGVEGVGAGGVAELPDEGGDFVVGGFFGDGEGEGGVSVVEDFEWGRWGRGAGGVVDGGGGFGGWCGREWGRGFAAD